MVRVSPVMSSAIDQYRREAERIPTRPEAIRAIVAEWLAANGFLTEADREE